MAKTSSKSSGKSSTRTSATNRPKPMTPKAGYTQTRRRYGDGGKAY